MSPNQDPLQRPSKQASAGHPGTLDSDGSHSARPRALSTCCSFIPPIALQSRYFYCPHFVDEETEGPGDELTGLRSRSLNLRTGIRTRAARPPSQGSWPRHLGASPSSACARIRTGPAQPWARGSLQPLPQAGWTPGSYIQRPQSLAQLQRPRAAAGGARQVGGARCPRSSLLSLLRSFEQAPGALGLSFPTYPMGGELLALPHPRGKHTPLLPLAQSLRPAGLPWASLLNSETEKTTPASSYFPLRWRKRMRMCDGESRKMARPPQAGTELREAVGGAEGGGVSACS